MLPHVRRFLEDQNITDIDLKFKNYWKYDSEWTNYTFVMKYTDAKYSLPFFEELKTARSIFACGMICHKRRDYDDAIKYYKSYCDMGNPDGDGCSRIAECYDGLGNADECVKYLGLSFKSKSKQYGHSLYHKYEDYDLRKSRSYFRQLGYLDDQTRVEHKIMDRFNILTDKNDYVLVYKLMVKYNKPEDPRLRQLIKKEYCDASGFIKVLSDIVVSYLIPNNKTRKNKNTKRQKLL